MEAKAITYRYKKGDVLVSTYDETEGMLLHVLGIATAAKDSTHEKYSWPVYRVRELGTKKIHHYAQKFMVSAKKKDIIMRRLKQ